MPLSRRDRKELEKTIAGITTENLKAMVGPDRRKHIREVLAAAESELKRRGVEVAPRSEESAAGFSDGDPEGTGRISGGLLLSD